MRFRKFSALVSVIVLALASMLTLAFSGEAQAAAGDTLYWCESSVGSFNTAANWRGYSSPQVSNYCSGGTEEVPGIGDNLVFDNSPISSGVNVTNNMPGLDLNSITFQGSGSGAYTLLGDDISLDNGITDSGTNSGSFSTVDLDITLTGNETFASTGNDNLVMNNTVDLGTNDLTLSGASTGLQFANLTGSGQLSINSSGANEVSYSATASNPSFSGPVAIGNNVVVIDNSYSLNGLGTGTITVNNGGALELIDLSTSATFPNNLVLDGGGNSVESGALVSCLGASFCTDDDTTLTFTGDVALNGDTDVVNGDYRSGQPEPSNSATFDFTGGLDSNGFSLAAFDPSDTNTIVNTPAADSDTAAAPGTPDTGTSLISSHFIYSLIGGALLCGALVTLVVISWKNSKSTSKSK